LKLKDILNILPCEVLAGKDFLDREVTAGCAADMMSDVLAFGVPGSLLITGLINAQSVRTAHLLDMAAIIYVRGKKPDQETIKLAEEIAMPLLSTPAMMYKACSKLFNAGLPPVPLNNK